MDVNQQIEDYLAAQPEPKQSDIREIHRIAMEAKPGCKLWFDDGKDENGKVLTNPTVGYGSYTISYANGKTKEFFRCGVSATKTGISVYVMGIADKAYLPQTFGERLGKAKVTGYCISFKALADIDIAVLNEAIRFGLEYGNAEAEG
jgi:hypothetical protein